MFRYCRNWRKMQKNCPQHGGKFWVLAGKRICKLIPHKCKLNLHKSRARSGSPQASQGGTRVAKPSGNNLINMLLEKTFHMSQPLAESKARLTSIQSYKRQFLMVTKATVTSSKTVDFSFRGPLGFEARTTLLAVNCDSEDQFAFESAGGNIEVIGLVDFTEIRPTCSEITIAIHYRIKNRLFAWLDRHLCFVDTFVNAELRSIRAHFEGIATSYVERIPIVPLVETAAAA